MKTNIIDLVRSLLNREREKSLPKKKGRALRFETLEERSLLDAAPLFNLTPVKTVEKTPFYDVATAIDFVASTYDSTSFDVDIILPFSLETNLSPDDFVVLNENLFIIGH